MNGDDRWDDDARAAYQLPIEGEEQARDRAILRLRRESATRRTGMGAWWVDPDATPLARATTGEIWIAQVPLEHGLHAYAFVIDGRDWAPDPSAPLAPVATFGRRNSLLVVGEDQAL